MKINLCQGLFLVIKTEGKTHILVELNFYGYVLLESWVAIAQFFETLACFCSNYLSFNSLYEIGPIRIMMVSTDNEVCLQVEISRETFYLTKHECRLITCVSNRVLARTDVFQNEGRFYEPISTKKEGK